MTRYFFTSMTRISKLREVPFEVEPEPRERWATGDFVVGEVNSRPNPLMRVELSTGRLLEAMEGSLLVGAFGRRHATLEVVGDWRHIGEDMEMDLLGGGGLFGKAISKSPFLPPPLALTYRGHVLVDGKKLTMRDCVQPVSDKSFTLPVVLVMGSSMSSGKTTTARILVRQLKDAGLKVLGVKLVGSGRYRDILSLRDAGADHIFDFVDVGLPTTVCPPDEYRQALTQLLARLAAIEADVAVIELGASPLEPYNGDIAYQVIQENVRCTALCASDAYAALGLITAFSMRPDIIAGLTTDTVAGIELVERLTGVKALNLLDRESLWELRDILRSALGY